MQEAPTFYQWSSLWS